MTSPRTCRYAGCGRPIRPSRKRPTCGRCTGGRRGAPTNGGSRARRRKFGSVWRCLARHEWESLYVAQGGRCAITGEPIRNRYDPADKTKTIAAVDHDHALEKELLAAGVEPTEALRRSVRGLLGWWGNRHVLPALRDDKEMALNAWRYLYEPPARKVLMC